MNDGTLVLLSGGVNDRVVKGRVNDGVVVLLSGRELNDRVVLFCERVSYVHAWSPHRCVCVHAAHVYIRMFRFQSWLKSSKGTRALAPCRSVGSRMHGRGLASPRR